MLAEFLSFNNLFVCVGKFSGHSLPLDLCLNGILISHDLSLHFKPIFIILGQFNPFHCLLEILILSDNVCDTVPHIISFFFQQFHLYLQFFDRVTFFSHATNFLQLFQISLVA